MLVGKTRCLESKSGEKKRGDVFLKKQTVSYEASKDCKSLESFFPKEKEEKSE